MKKTTIYFLRHGEVYNPKQVLYGRLPGFSLSRDGRDKLEQVANLFHRIGITQIYTSPLLRTRQTAQIIGSRLNIAPRVSYLINEVKLIFSGVKLQDFREKYQSTMYSVGNISKGQESIDAIGVRMLKFLQMILKRHPGEKILVVSHGDPIMILRAITEKVEFTPEFKKSTYLKPASFFTLVCKNGEYIWK